MPPRDTIVDLTERHRQASQNLALLSRYAEAEQYANRGGTHPDLEHEAWAAVERLIEDAHEVLDDLNDRVDHLELCA